MATRNRLRFVHVQVLWMSIVTVFLVYMDSLSLNLFFVLSLLGFLLLIEFTAPVNVTPLWRDRLRLIITLGLIVFLYIVVQIVLEKIHNLM